MEGTKILYPNNCAMGGRSLLRGFSACIIWKNNLPALSGCKYSHKEGNAKKIDIKKAINENLISIFQEYSSQAEILLEKFSNLLIKFNSDLTSRFVILKLSFISNFVEWNLLP